MSPRVIYGTVDVAKSLNVETTTFANWLKRYDDTPAPAFLTMSGRMFWTSTDVLETWPAWRAGKACLNVKRRTWKKKK